ncbi:helix-turn-helix transcriptional regulator [Boseaceae bacterium BT-24-1]|nr:helix-turn-helix transcriptional regulator [Boseaceae bacterium BT-24-1]
MNEAAQHARAMAAIASGEMETLSADEVRSALAEPTLIAFWRKKRSLSISALASALSLPAEHLAEIESGIRPIDPELLRSLALNLSVQPDHLT